MRDHRDVKRRLVSATTVLPTIEWSSNTHHPLISRVRSYAHTIRAVSKAATSPTVFSRKTSSVSSTIP